MNTKDEYQGKEVTIFYDASKCYHAGVCVQTLPKVFQANVKGAWIAPDNAEAEDIAALAHNCPSGAITYKRHDKDKQEQPPYVNTIKILENGPLSITADIEMDNSEPQIRATLCRCGASKNKPYCDGMHEKIGFTATGEVEPKTTESLPQKNGKLKLSILKDGPILCSGNMEIFSGTGRRTDATKEAALCRCGASKDKPYCDGSHVAIGFTAE